MTHDKPMLILLLEMGLSARVVFLKNLNIKNNFKFMVFFNFEFSVKMNSSFQWTHRLKKQVKGKKGELIFWKCEFNIKCFKAKMKFVFSKDKFNTKDEIDFWKDEFNVKREFIFSKDEYGTKKMFKDVAFLYLFFK